MPFVGRIGGAVQKGAEVSVEWSIRDFFSLSDEVDDSYRSPVFCFDDSRWYLELYPNGETDSSTAGWVGLYVMRVDSERRRTVNYSFGIKSFGELLEKKEEKHEFTAEYKGWGFPTLWTRKKLQNEMSRLMPDNVFVISCHLKCSEPKAAEASLCDRVWRVSSSMKSILEHGKRADFTLKLGEREWPVHKVILESRCEYFENMFRHEWVENAVGEVTFDDIEGEALDSVLCFLYTGLVEHMSFRNVCETYVAAHKFLLDDLKALCVEHMRGNMCAEMVCKVFAIADTYGEGDLYESAVQYFIREADQIFDSEKWREFKQNHPSAAAELLEETTKRERKKRSEE